MRKLSQQNGFSLLIVIPVVLVLLSGSGYVVYERQQDKKKQADLQQQIDQLKNQSSVKEEKELAQSQSVTTQTLSEDEKILNAAACKTSDQCKIVNKNSQAAHVVKGGDAGGVNVFVAKKGDNWQLIYEGNGDVPPSVAAQYNIPDSWIGPQCTDC